MLTLGVNARGCELGGRERLVERGERKTEREFEAARVQFGAGRSREQVRGGGWESYDG